MHTKLMKLTDVHITWSKGTIAVVPKSQSVGPIAERHDPIKVLFLSLMEHEQTYDPKQAYNELMKVSEFRDMADDRHFEADFGDLIDPNIKGYRGYEIYRMLGVELRKAGRKGLSDDAIKEWFDKLEPKLAA